MASGDASFDDLQEVLMEDYNFVPPQDSSHTTQSQQRPPPPYPGSASTSSQGPLSQQNTAASLFAPTSSQAPLPQQNTPASLFASTSSQAPLTQQNTPASLFAPTSSQAPLLQQNTPASMFASTSSQAPLSQQNTPASNSLFASTTSSQAPLSEQNPPSSYPGSASAASSHRGPHNTLEKLLAANVQHSEVSSTGGKRHPSAATTGVQQGQLRHFQMPPTIPAAPSPHQFGLGVSGVPTYFGGTFGGSLIYERRNEYQAQPNLAKSSHQHYENSVPPHSVQASTSQLAPASTPPKRQDSLSQQKRSIARSPRMEQVTQSKMRSGENVQPSVFSSDAHSKPKPYCRTAHDTSTSSASKFTGSNVHTHADWQMQQAQTMRSSGTSPLKKTKSDMDAVIEGFSNFMNAQNDEHQTVLDILTTYHTKPNREINKMVGQYMGEISSKASIFISDLRKSLQDPHATSTEEEVAAAQVTSTEIQGQSSQVSAEQYMSTTSEDLLFTALAEQDTTTFSMGQSSTASAERDTSTVSQGYSAVASAERDTTTVSQGYPAVASAEQDTSTMSQDQLITALAEQDTTSAVSPDQLF